MASDWTDFARRAAKAAAAGALHYSGLQGVLARAARVAVGGQRVLMISYHRIVEDFEQEAKRAIPGLLLSRRTFERHIEALHQGGFEIVPLGTACDALAGAGCRGRDLAVLTFDDGYRDVYEHAFPVLKRLGLPATVYLASGFVGSKTRFPHDRLYHLLTRTVRAEGKPGRNVIARDAAGLRAAVQVDSLIAGRSAEALLQLIARLEEGLGGGSELLPASGEVLDWDQVRTMARAGIEFGAHTVNHVVLTHETEAGIDREVLASKRDIEAHLGRPVVDFAYPNGFYDRRVVAALVRHGFRSAVTTEDLPNRVGGDPYRLRRKTMWENYSRGPFGYSPALTACHLDDIFTLLALTRPVNGEQPLPGPQRLEIERTISA